MTRRMTPAPNNVTIVKTSRNTWIALREIWKGDRLVDVHPMRDLDNNAITQRLERRLMLVECERVMLATRLAEAQEEIEQLRAQHSQHSERRPERPPRAG